MPLQWRLLNLSLLCEGEAGWWWTAGEQAGHAAGLKKFAGSHGRDSRIVCLFASRLWFQISFIFTTPGEMIQFDEHVFQMG